MEGEGLVGGVPCGCGLETSHVGAVSEFSLGVAADNLEILGFLEEDFLLLRRALVLEGDLWEMVSRRLFSSSRKHTKNMLSCSLYGVLSLNSSFAVLKSSLSHPSLTVNCLNRFALARDVSKRSMRPAK